MEASWDSSAILVPNIMLHLYFSVEFVILAYAQLNVVGIVTDLLVFVLHQDPDFRKA